MNTGSGAVPVNTLAGLRKTCATHGLPYADAWQDRLRQLAGLLAAGQVRTNLVGDATEAGLTAHVREALTVVAAAEAAFGHAPARAVDVGAGAGLEALTLAIAWPQTHVLAIEPRKLRAAFIAETAAALGLRNLAVTAKTLHSAEAGQLFELATARAVWPYPEWPEKARGLLQPGGVAVCHAFGPAATLSERLTAPGWTLAAGQDVPGDKNYAIAVLRPTRAG